jgi:hypothetical protein
MSPRLRDLLDDLATEARVYGEPDLAVTAARRRTAGRRGAAAVAAAVVAITAAVVVALPGLAEDPAPRPAPAESQGVPGYPTRVTPPASPVPLPDAAIGAAAFVYAPCARDCDPLLVMPDGRQYLLPTPVLGPPLYGITLSPDGAWLGLAATDGFALKNLVTGADLFVADTGRGVTAAWVWSPDSRRLLLSRHVDGTVDHYTLVDTSVSSYRRLSSTCDSVMAVRNDGRLVCWFPHIGGLPELGVFDPSTGGLADRFRLRLPPGGENLLREGDDLRDPSFLLGPSDDGGITVLYAVPPRADPLTLAPTAYLTISLADRGLINGRTTLPESGPDVLSSAGIWFVRGYLVGGLVLEHHDAERSDIVIQNDVTGQRTVATVLPAQSQIMPRGSARY